MTKLFARICVCICICTALQEITLCVTRPRPAITHRHLVPPHYIHIIARNHASPCSYQIVLNHALVCRLVPSWSCIVAQALDIHVVIEPPTPSTSPRSYLRSYQSEPTLEIEIQPMQ